MTAAVDTTIDLPVDGTPVALAAEMYAQLGFKVLPVYGLNANNDGCACGSPDCQPRSWAKHPIGKRWQKEATSDLDEVRDVFRGHRGNIGIMPGVEFCTIDIDGDEGFRSIESLPDLPLTLTSRSGSGNGEHRIFSYAKHHDPESITNRRVLPGVDVKTRTGQIVVAPSIHRSGERYRWIVPIAPAPLPDSLYEQIRKAPARVVSLPTPRAESVAGDLEKRARAYVAKIPPAISGSGGHDQTFAAARAIAGFVDKGLDEATAWDLLVEYNAGCQPSWSEKELSHKFTQAMGARTKPALADREKVVPLRSGQSSAGSSGDDGTPPPPSPGEHWRAKLVYVATSKGAKPAKHPENATVVLRYHPAWEGRVRLDTHSQNIMVTDAPWSETNAFAASKGTVEWTDHDSQRLSNWILRELNVELSREACEQAVLVAADAAPYHPVRDYFNSLAWDQSPRLATAPARYFGCAQNAYTMLVFRWWMIAAVARTYIPGEKVDNVLILEGEQGLRKSSALRVLAGRRWFSDTPIDLQSKDAYLSLNGKLVVELAELESLRRVDANRAKTFFTSSEDTYRPPYGRRMVTIPRGCVFAGTVNPDGDYLKDATGARRYWPLRCTAIDLDALAADRDQLWAEAVHWYRAGAKWYPQTPEEVATCRSEQDPRGEVDAWEPKVAEWLAGQTSAPTVGDVMERALGIEPGKWSRADQMRVASILGRLGYQRRRGAVDGSGQRPWRYHPLGQGKVAS